MIRHILYLHPALLFNQFLKLVLSKVAGRAFLIKGVRNLQQNDMAKTGLSHCTKALYIHKNSTFYSIVHSIYTVFLATHLHHVSHTQHQIHNLYSSQYLV